MKSESPLAVTGAASKRRNVTGNYTQIARRRRSPSSARPPSLLVESKTNTSDSRSQSRRLRGAVPHRRQRDRRLVAHSAPYSHKARTPFEPRRSRWKYKRLCERADTGMQNRENNNLPEQSRGKEKIRDLKCPWSMLSESSDGGSDSPFSHSDDYSGPS